MHTNAVDLKEFYETLQGKVVQRIIRQHIRNFWPGMKGQRIVGLGYATPYLRPFMDEADRVIALMPQQYGAVFWPSEAKGLVSICDEGELPIESSSIDRLLIIHTMQSAESMGATLQEAWRVLTGQGRLVIVVPNRSGIWARLDNTPFGHGTPYSVGQIRHFLKEYMFVPERVERALFFPPSSSRLLLATSGIWEKVGYKLFNAFGGVNIVEASKQLYAGTLVGTMVTQRQRVLAPRPVSSVERG